MNNLNIKDSSSELRALVRPLESPDFGNRKSIQKFTDYMLQIIILHDKLELDKHEKTKQLSFAIKEFDDGFLVHINKCESVTDWETFMLPKRIGEIKEFIEEY